MVFKSLLRRLFSTFLSGGASFGLLLLRCWLGIGLTYSRTAGLLENSQGPDAFAKQAIAVLGGIFLFAGL
jgi:hypothetical protein